MAVCKRAYVKGGRGRSLRLDVLAQPRLLGVVVLGHVAASAATGRYDGRLEGGRLEILDLEGRLGALAYVARAATARGLEVRHGGRCDGGIAGCRGNGTGLLGSSGMGTETSGDLEVCW